MAIRAPGGAKKDTDIGIKYKMINVDILDHHGTDLASHICFELL